MHTPDPCIDIDCRWTEDIWAWAPRKGRWSPAFARPQRCVELRLATAPRGGPQAYEAWRSNVYYGFEADTPDRATLASFSAHLRGLISPDAEFHAFAQPRLSGRRTQAHISADESQDIDIGLILKGVRRCRYEDGSESIAGAGEFYVYDNAQPCTLDWEPHEALQISLSRKVLQQATGLKHVSHRHLQAALLSSALTAFLRAQLLTLHAQLDRLSDWERDTVLAATRDLTLNLLRSCPGAPDADHDQDRLFTAACAFIRSHLAHPGLSVAMISEQLGCSRATLYRSFSRFNLTVAGYIREQRLLAMRARLYTLPTHIPIADIAAQCGLYDAPNVSRLYRARFGMSPSAARATARAVETNGQDS